MNALSISPQSAVEISVLEEGEPIEMKIINEGVVIEVTIQTFDSDAELDFEFARGKKVPRLVLDSATLRAAIEHWDAIGQSTRIVMSPTEPHFSIVSRGVVGTVTVQFNPELVNKESAFRCPEKVKERYQTSFIKAVLGPCRNSSHVSFRIDSKGILQVQHLIMVQVQENVKENVFLTFFVNSDVILNGESDAELSS